MRVNSLNPTIKVAPLEVPEQEEQAELGIVKWVL